MKDLLNSEPRLKNLRAHAENVESYNACLN